LLLLSQSLSIFQCAAKGRIIFRLIFGDLDFVKGEIKLFMFHESLKHRAAKLGLRGRDLAALANLSGSRLSNFFRGREELDTVTRENLVHILDDMEELKKFFPIPIGVHDIKLLALAIWRLQENKFVKFREVMQQANWEPDAAELEHVKRHHPRLFKDENK
jgi:transcriptional regulator with XRE-family HTH domain